MLLSEIQFVESASERTSICEKILRSLPDWFGIESAIIDYCQDVQKMPTWSIKSQDKNIGFISINMHNHVTAEIHVMGIDSKLHRSGYGKQLVLTAEKYLTNLGYKYLTVKTLSESREDINYAQTRQFYLKMGFEPVEEFKTLWGEHNPCLFLLKNLKVDEETGSLEISLPEYTFDQDLKETPTDFEKFEQFILDLIEKLKNTTQANTQRQLFEVLGVACRIIGFLDQAQYYLQRAVALSAAEKPAKQVQNLIRLAHVYQWQKQFHKSQVFFDQAKALIQQYKVSESLKASYHQHFGKFYFDQGFFNLATIEFQTAKKIRTQIQSPADQLNSTLLALIESEKRQILKMPAQILIRHAELADAEAIHAAHMLSINEICSKDHAIEEIRVWGGRSFSDVDRSFAIQQDFYLVVETLGKIEGFCQLKLKFENDQMQAHLHGLYLTPQVLKKNIGHVLMNLVFEFCQANNVKLITLKSSITAKNFYLKHGFSLLGEKTFVQMRGVPVSSYSMQREI